MTCVKRYTSIVFEMYSHMPTGMYVNVSLLDLSRMVPGVGPTLACCEPPVSVTNTDKAASCQHDLCEQPRNPDSEKHLTRATTLDYSNYRDAMSRVHVDVSHEVEKATANENAETNRQPKKRSEASMRVGELLKKTKLHALLSWHMKLQKRQRVQSMQH